jgi:CBS domain-containing membrane protein
MSTTPVRPAASRWLRGFLPTSLPVDARQRLRMVVGVFLGIVVTSSLSRWMPPAAGLTWSVAPMGASAVLVFCLPASPLAQPWAVVGGSTASALAGLACAGLIAHPDWAAAVAVAAAVWLTTITLAG